VHFFASDVFFWAFGNLTVHRGKISKELLVFSYTEVILPYTFTYCVDHQRKQFCVCV